MFEEILQPETAALLKKFESSDWIKDFYLAGGTALALQYGHRQSIDLDWFSFNKINPDIIISNLLRTGDFKVTQKDNDTVQGVLDEVNMSFFFYPYKMLHNFIPYLGNIFLADPRDIAAMKIAAITGRSAKKDFIDLYFFMNKERMSLSDVFIIFDEKFSGAYDKYHVYKSLVFFEDADREVMPMMKNPISWDEVKDFFIREVNKLKQ